MYIQVLLYVAIALAAVYLFSKRRPKKGKIIPGPIGLPIIGYAHKINSKTAYQTFYDLAKKYGDIFQINSVGQPIIVLNSADAVRSFFCDEPYARFGNDRPKLFWNDKVSYGCKGMFPSDAFNSPHAALKKIFVRGTHVYGEGIPTFENTVQTELGKLIEQIDSFKGKDIEMKLLIENFLHNVFSIFFSGEPVNDDYMRQVIRDFNLGSNILLNPVANHVLSTIPALRFIPGQYKKTFEDTIRARDALTQRYVHDAKKTYQPGQIRGLIDFYFNEQRLTKDKNVSDEQICAMLVVMLYAGIEATLSHLSSFFLCVMNYPEYQTKMQEEIDRVIGRGRLPVMSDKNNCPFIEAVSLEVHRFITTAPYPAPHACKTNIAFRGYDIPENSMIQLNSWHIHHDEKVWGDPWTFRPERWLDDDGALLPSDHVLRKSFMPFGTGRRQCVGESLVRSRAFLFVATVLQRWSFEMPPGHAVSCDPRDGGMHFELLCCPKPYLGRAVPRNTA